MLQEGRKEQDLQQLLDYAARRQGWASLPARMLRQQLATLKGQKRPAKPGLSQDGELKTGAEIGLGC